MDWVAPGLSSGLGNRLFQHAAAAGAAERWKRPLVFLESRQGISPHGDAETLYRMFPSVPRTDSKEPYGEFKEGPRGYYIYMPLPAPPSRPVVISGIRQSPRYFPTDLNRLVPDWNSAISQQVREEIEGGIDSANTVSIHVRLGDYLVLAHHQVDLGFYYKKALGMVAPGTKLRLFSDEPDRCSDVFAAYAAARGLPFTVAAKRRDVESLYEMSLCRAGNIVANSTFSWWAAWFAHYNGSPWATYPDNWGNGMPEPTDLFPVWGSVLKIEA